MPRNNSNVNTNNVFLLNKILKLNEIIANLNVAIAEHLIQNRTIPNQRSRNLQQNRRVVYKKTDKKSE